MNPQFNQPKGSLNWVTDHKSVARAANVAVSAVIFSSEKNVLLDSKTVIYDEVAEKIWGKPSGIPAGSKIVDITGSNLTYTGGTVVPMAPVPNSAPELKSQLSGDSGGGYVGYKSTLAGAVHRTVLDKMQDVINIKDFGAIGDGQLHPLSEKFSTLAAAQMVYPFVTSLTQTQDYAGTQAAINASKSGKSVFSPSGKYEINKGLVADFALSMYGEGAQGLRTIDTSVHSPSPVRGTVFNSHVVTGRMLSIDSGNAYCFGMTLRDFAIWGVDGECDVGLYLNGVGWMGIVEGVNIQFFPNQALEIGYIQDTYFTNCSFLQSGSQSKPAVTCLVESNYVYFHGCHFELTPYMAKFNLCWFFFFTDCHFEVARPVRNGSTLDDRFVYSSAAIDFGNSYRFFFKNNVFVPTDVAYLATKLGVARTAVPYFMTGTGDVFSFTGDTFLAPEGTIKCAYFSGSDIDMNGVKVVRADPSAPSLRIGDGKIVNSSIGIDAVVDTTNLYGVYVGTGQVSNTKFGFYGSDASGTRAQGALIYGAPRCSNNTIPVDNRIKIYIDVGATVEGYDGGKPFFVSISATQDIDLTRLHPAANILINGGTAVQITHIYGSPYGRDLVVVSNITGAVLKFVSGNLITKGAVDFTIPQYNHILLKCIDDGSPSMYQIG